MTTNRNPRPSIRLAASSRDSRSFTRASRTAKKSLSVLLAIVLCLWALPSQVFADEATNSQVGNRATEAEYEGTKPTASENGLRASGIGMGASSLRLGENSQAVAEYNNVKFSTLQEALNAATSGGEVLLIAHVEEGDLTFPADGITLNLGGHTLTISEGKKGFIIRNQKTLKDGLSNITICNGAVTGSKSKLWVDTLYARNLTLRDLTFSDLNLIDGLDGISICRSDAVMENCRIENIIGSISNNAGAMIAVESSTLTMNSCTVENCESGGSTIEAGVDNYLKTSPTLTMNDCRIAYNTGSYCGGLQCTGAGSGNPRWAMIALNDTVITGNRARNKGYSSGGLNMLRTQLRMIGGAIYGNFVPDDAEKSNSGSDVYVYKGYTNMVIPKASDMKDGTSDLKSYFWIDTISNTPYENGIDMGRNVNLSIPMGLKVDCEPLMVARNVRTGTEYLTLSEAVAAAQAGDTLQLCAADNGGGHVVTEDTDIAIGKNLTIDLNGHHLNGLSSMGKVLTIKDGFKLSLIGGRTNDKGGLEANEVDGAIESFGQLEIYGAITFKDKIFHRGQKLFITGSHGTLRISLAKGNYIEADKGMTADRVQVYLLDAAERAALNDRYHDHEDVLIGKGGTEALESVTSTPEIDNPHVRRIHKANGHLGEGLYLVDKIPSGIFLDGANGNDGAAGTEGAPVKTFAKAKELLEQKISSMKTRTTSLGTQAENEGPDGIYVMGTMTVAGTESWSMPEGTEMIRHEHLHDAVVRVTGNLTLENIVIDGLSEGGVTAGSALIDVNGGTLTLGEGAVVRNNTNTTESTIASTGNSAGGILARNKAQVILKGGAVTDNEAGLGGGIGLYGGSTLTMSDGAIARNRAVRAYHFGDTLPAGGGVFVAGSSKMDFSGGLISENMSEFYGGGISLGGYTFATISFNKDAKGSLNMTGGVIDGNTASANGGGIFVQANTVATVSAGSITNNAARAASNRLFAGGGIYVSSNAGQSDLDYGSLNLTNVVITDNEAREGGGGIGACPTSLTLVFVSSGAAIYGNEAPLAHDVLIDARTGSNVYGLRSDHVAYISHYMLGGGEARWQRDGDDLNTEDSTIEQLNGHTHMTTHRSLELKAAPTDEDIQKALKAATVRISGNYSGSRGGGLGSNGNVRIGTRWDISAQKEWEDGDNADGIRPKSVKVRLKATVPYKGETVEIPSDAIPFEADATLNEDNKWKHTWHDLPEVVPEDNPAVAQYKNLEITYRVDELDVPEGYSCAVNGNMFEGYTIKNKHEPEKTSIPVKKVWNDTGLESVRPKSVTVNLSDGQNVRELVLSEENNWSGSFDDLPVNRDGKKIEYTLSEVGVAGYTSAVTRDDKTGSYTVTNTPLGMLKLSKKVEGDLADPDYAFSFKVRFHDADGNELDKTEFPYTGDAEGRIASGGTVKLKGGQSVVIEGLPEGTKWSVGENPEDAHGYEVLPMRGEVHGAEAEQGVITLGTMEELAYTNVKNKGMGGFTVSKSVKGDAADSSQEFHFQVRFYDASGEELTDAEFSFIGDESGMITSGDEFSLKHGRSVEFSGIPEGTRWEVRETPDTAHGYEIEPVRGTVKGTEAETSHIAAGAIEELAYTNEKNATMGKLSIQKTVKGEGADKTREFDFKVTIGDAPETVVDESAEAEFAYVGSRSGLVANGGIIQLRHGEKVTIEGLPSGTPFKVEEVAVKGYKSTSEGAQGEIEAGNTSSASFVNTPVDKKVPGSPDDKPLKSALAKTGDPLVVPLTAAVMMMTALAALVFARIRRNGRDMK